MVIPIYVGNFPEMYALKIREATAKRVLNAKIVRTSKHTLKQRGIKPKRK